MVLRVPVVPRCNRHVGRLPPLKPISWLPFLLGVVMFFCVFVYEFSSKNRRGLKVRGFMTLSVGHSAGHDHRLLQIVSTQLSSATTVRRANLHGERVSARHRTGRGDEKARCGVCPSESRVVWSVRRTVSWAKEYINGGWPLLPALLFFYFVLIILSKAEIGMGELFNLTCLLEGPLASLVNQDSVVEADGLLILPHERGHHRSPLSLVSSWLQQPQTSESSEVSTLLSPSLPACEGAGCSGPSPSLVLPSPHRPWSGVVGPCSRIHPCLSALISWPDSSCCTEQVIDIHLYYC